MSAQSSGVQYSRYSRHFTVRTIWQDHLADIQNIGNWRKWQFLSADWESEVVAMPAAGPFVTAATMSLDRHGLTDAPLQTWSTPDRTSGSRAVCIVVLSSMILKLCCAMDKSFKLFDQVKFYTQPTNTIPQNALNDFQRDKGCWNARCFPFNACKVQRCRQHTMLFGFPCPSSRRLPMTWDWSVCVCGQ